MEIERRKIPSKRNLTLIIQENALKPKTEVDIFIVRGPDAKNLMSYTRLAAECPKENYKKEVERFIAIVLSDQYGED